ncbi:MAG: hypothetical protein JXK16_01135 [Thiotrichales bacterium]|nr:hypothetical protein [Thiotrichales bacterium]
MNEIQEPQQTALFKAIKRILRPMVSLMLRQGITYTAFIDLLKDTYVEVADQEFVIDGKRQTDSRISVLTGVHRKEVKRIREMDVIPLEPKERKASLSAQLMAYWLGNPDCIDENGKPLALPRVSVGKEISFDSMVKAVTKDVHPRSLLDAWLNQGVVVLDADGLVMLQESGYVPDADYEEKLYFAGKNIGDHLAVVKHNLAGEDSPMLDRAVYYQNLSETSVQTLETFSRRASINLLTEVNQLAGRLHAQDQALDSIDHRYKIHFGTYFYRQDSSDSHE